MFKLKREPFKEDLYEIVLTLSILLGSFLIVYTFPIYTYIHEGGHAFVCMLYGGTASEYKTTRGYETRCILSYNWTAFQSLQFYMAGILAESIVSFLLFLPPITSPLGSFLLIKTGEELKAGVFAYDLCKASAIIPQIAQLMDPLIVYPLALATFPLSIFYLWRFIKRRDIF